MSLKSRDKLTKKPRKITSILLLIVAVVLLASGTYLLILVATPTVLIPSKPFDIESVSKSPDPAEKRLYIPKIGVDIPFRTGGAEVLDNSAWHRLPERGDPEKGGNFILSAHRFEIGLTPGQTWQKSPFFHIDKLEVGDEMAVNFSGKHYRYKITEKRRVKPTEVSIEAPSTDDHMTLYSCTLGGERDGREVIFAKLSK